MKRTGIRLAALMLCILLPVLTSGCDKKKNVVWDGYENADLSAYVTPGNYRGLPYTTVIPEEVTDKEVDAALQAFLTEHEYEADITDRASVLGDSVVCDYALTVDGTLIPLFTATEKTFTAGDGNAISGIASFGESLVGHKAGDSYTVGCDLAEDFAPEGDTAGIKLKGKHGEMQITVTRVYEMRIPEPDDTFFSSISEGLTAEAFTSSLRERLTLKNDMEAKEVMRAEIWEQAMAAASFLTYPDDELSSRRLEMHAYYKECAASSGMTLADYLASVGYTEESLAVLEEQYAKKAVSESLLLYSIARTEGISVSDEEYRQGLTLYYTLYGAELKDEAEYEMKNGKTALLLVLLHDKVTDFLLTNGVSLTNGVTSSTEQ